LVLAGYYRNLCDSIHFSRFIKQRCDMKFKIRRSSDGQYYYVLVATNGKIMVTSETMRKKQSCEDSIYVIVEHFYKNPVVKIEYEL